jgi:type I restriction enzyme S subunit
MKVKLKEVVKEFIVPMRDKPSFISNGIPWCRIEDIEGKYLNGTKSHQYLSNEIIKKMNLKVIPKNSVLFTCSASVGIVSINTVDLCTNQTFIGLVPSNKLNKDYLYYLLRLHKRNFLRLASVTTIPYISREKFEDFEIDLHDLKSQNSIANILNSLDSKIELNNRINAELEAMAKTLYDYWFVQFDFPFDFAQGKPDENGKPYKTSGGKMVWNEELKREIPEGWEIESIEKSCSIIDCLHSKKSDLVYENQQSYLLQLNNILDNGLIDLTDKYYVTSAEYKKWTTRIEVIDGDIVITNAGRVAATAQIPMGVKAGIGRNITAIRPRSICHTYLFLSFQGADVKRQIKLNTDSGAFFTSFNVKGIKKLQLIRANKNLEEQFEKMVLPIRRRRELNNIENQKLTELRDWLLPMLMNGQVKVK